MRVKEFIDYVNYNDFYSLYDVEDSLKSYLNPSITEVAENLESAMHKINYRWFEISTTVYKLENGFVGVSGVSTIYSEDMEPEDCCVKCTACEYKEIKTVSYKRK